MESNPTRVAIVEDQLTILDCLHFAIDADPRFQVVGIAQTGEEALKQFEKWKADVVIMDMLLSGKLSGIQTIQQMRLINPHTRIVVCTGYDEPRQFIQTFNSGVQGYVLKTSSNLSSIFSALCAVRDGLNYIDPVMRAKIEEIDAAKSHNILTEREHEIMCLIARNFTNGQIARLTEISIETVKVHVKNVLHKLCLRDRRDVPFYALRRGIIGLKDIDFPDSYDITKQKESLQML